MNRSFWMFEQCSELGHTWSKETELSFCYNEEGDLDCGQSPQSFEEAIHSAKLANEKYNEEHSKKRKLEMIIEYNEFMMLMQSHTL